ncbi:UNVERIFIED_CONTAM: Methionine aminopeptidase 1D [Trichonephila clavipes]
MMYKIRECRKLSHKCTLKIFKKVISNKETGYLVSFGPKITLAIMDYQCSVDFDGKIGVMTEELDAIAHNTCINFGAYPSPLNYRGFPKSICTSVNNVACHGIPDDRKLKDGDIISVDISVSIICY